MAAKVQRRDFPAGPPFNQLHRIGADRHGIERIRTTESLQNGHAIRADLKPGADFADLIGLLHHGNLVALPGQGCRRGKSADACARDCDFQFIRHESNPIPPLPLSRAKAGRARWHREASGR